MITSAVSNNGCNLIGQDLPEIAIPKMIIKWQHLVVFGVARIAEAVSDLQIVLYMTANLWGHRSMTMF